MTLLDFARGPAFQWSLIVMIFGVLWRLLGVILLMYRKDKSKPRDHNAVVDGVLVVATRSLPAHQFEKRIRFQHYTGYAWHIGLFITVLFSAPHILFFEDVLGFGWPNLPNSFIVIAAAITLAILIAVTIRRAMHPVMRLISNADDYISLAVTIAPLVTGILASAHFGLRYETMLALHWLSVDALFVWFPFGKLIHAFLIFPARYHAGAALGRRGVQA